jgi:hypothetical protein
MFHPFKYQIVATLIGSVPTTTATENSATLCTLKLNRGANEEHISFPTALLPREIAPGESFILNIEPKEASTQNEAEILKNLLSELIK